MRKQYIFLQERQDRVKLCLAEKNRIIEDLQNRLAAQEDEDLKMAQELGQKTVEKKNKVIEDLQHGLAAQEAEHLKLANELERKIIELNEKTKTLDAEKKDLLKLNQDLRQEMQEAEERHKITVECLKSENVAQNMALSEKDSIIRNVHEQIVKLEEEKESLVIVHAGQSAVPKSESVPRADHDRIVRELNRRLSEETEKNFGLGDMRTVYKDELDCMKVNLTSAEELQKHMKATITTLSASNAENSKRSAAAERELAIARERIDLLNAQVEVYRHDFQMEREAREKLASEKDNILTDLGLLQKRNKELIDEAQKNLANGTSPGPSTGAIRKTPPQSKEATPDIEQSVKYVCPLCNIETTTLRLLEQHLETCLKD